MTNSARPLTTKLCLIHDMKRPTFETGWPINGEVDNGFHPTSHRLKFSIAVRTAICQFKKCNDME